MKIVLVDSTISGNLIGGAQMFLVGFLRGLSERDHEVHFVSADVPNEILREKLAATGAKMHCGLWPANGLVDDATPVFADWLNELKPDVHLISASGDLGWTVLPLLDPQIATVTIGHNDQETFYAPVKHYAKFLTRAVGVSEEICRKYREECGMPAESVTWIPYGVEVLGSEPAVHIGPLRLLYVGRLDEEQKRISDVVKIIKLLGERGVDFTFDIVGDGDEKAFVKQELLDEIATGQVRLHGWLPSEQVIAVMRKSEVFVLASAYEGFCIALVEAMANGCAPVVTDIRSGNKQLVEDGVNGFVVPVGEAEAFADRIEFLASDRSSLSGMRRQAWETGREYSVDRMVDNYVRCFESAVADARANPRVVDPEFPLMESCRSMYPLWLRRMVAKFRS